MHRTLILLSMLAACSNNNQMMTMQTPPDMSTIITDPCLRACYEGQSQGAALYDSFQACLGNACSQFEPGSDAEFECALESFSPGFPDAKCRAETDACFSGSVMGCKELADAVEQTCEPSTLPISDNAFGEVVFCIITTGWKGAPAAQAIAWPLFNCTFADPPDGCLAECQMGGAACRACAQQKCNPLYDQCMAQTSALVDTAPTAAVASCRAIHSCALNCSP